MSTSLSSLISFFWVLRKLSIFNVLILRCSHVVNVHISLIMFFFFKLGIAICLVAYSFNWCSFEYLQGWLIFFWCFLFTLKGRDFLRRYPILPRSMMNGGKINFWNRNLPLQMSGTLIFFKYLWMNLDKRFLILF